MSWLNNLKIATKIALIVCLFTLVTIGGIWFAALKLKEANSAYADLLNRVNVATVTNARAGRSAERYVSKAFQVAAETSDAGNARLSAEIIAAKQQTETRLASVLKSLPEKSVAIQNLIDQFSKSFAACTPAVTFAGKTSTPEDALKAAARLQAECDPVIKTALADATKMSDDLTAYSVSEADRLAQQADSSIVMIVVAVGLGLLFVLSIAMFIAIKGLSQPIGRLKAVMQAFANNDLKHDVPGIGRRDELGEMARTVEVFKTNGLEVARLREEQAATDAQRAVQRKAEMMKLANDFEGVVGAIIQTVSSAATELESSANTLTATAGRTEQLCTVVASAAEEASTNVQSVASATEEMSSSVNEISRQVQESERIAGDAVMQAESTNARVNELSESAKKIGDVVKLISTIAEQTNLLALNATIEAARAGEAGRGFAVVASEVKALAEQTSKATGEIGAQIAAIQTATEGSVTAIQEISSTIGRISEISSTIAAAVEQQGAATQEISRNVQQAAHGTTEVASNIADVQRGSSETGSASSQVLSSAQSLSVESNRLKMEVQGFLATVRAA